MSRRRARSCRMMGLRLACWWLRIRMMGRLMMRRLPEASQPAPQKSSVAVDEQLSKALDLLKSKAA